ncbi:MAG: hypothetical protein II882_10060 [Lachnospiraceae bacterium]|nr:hypothetical protein [Lachnospiraceae bacterium]
MRIACIGDSNTFGYDPLSVWGGRYARGVRWTGRLAGEADAVFNHGVNGLAAADVSAHAVFVQELLSEQPLDLVTVMLGTNDILQGFSAAQTAGKMRKLLTAVQSAQAADTLLLIAPPVLITGQWVEGPEMIEESEALSSEYQKLAEELDISFADAGKWSVALSFDGVHFTPEGHAVFAAHIRDFIQTNLYPKRRSKMKQMIHTPNAPAAIGPYSQAIEADGWIFVSGQIPVDPATGAFAGESIEKQSRQSLENIKAILEAAGCSMANVVKTNVSLADMNDFAAMNAIYAEYFAEPYPARAAVQVAKLPKGARVEIEAIARR